MFPPGFAKLATKAGGDWIAARRHYNRDPPGRELRGPHFAVPGGDDHVDVEAHQLSRKGGQQLRVLVC